MKTNFTKIVSLVCALVMILGIMPFGAVAANVTTGHHAQISDHLVYDVDLSIGGDSKVMDTDIVFMPYGWSTVDEVFFTEVLELFMPLVQAGSRVRIGVVGMSENGHEVILDLNNDPRAVLPNDATAITTLLEEVSVDVEYYAGGVNLESALLTAKDMLAKDTSVPADRKYLFMFNSGNTYFFDNDEGKTSTVPVYDALGIPCWGNLTWMKIRNNNRNNPGGYLLPGWYTSWNEYWVDVVNWIAQDQDDYAYTLQTSWKNINTDVVVSYGGNAANTDRFGYLFPANDTPTIAAPFGGLDQNPKTYAAAAHAIAYDRAQYEAWLAWEQLSQPAGATITSVLKDENGNPKTYEALGFNCFPIYAGDGPDNTIGYHFMNMLADGNLTIYGNGMFSSIASEILDSVSAGSYVINEIDADFDFVADASKLTVDFGGQTYKATETSENVFEFCADGSETVSFKLEYDPATDSFKFTTYETPNNTKIANLNYQVTLETLPEATDPYKMYVSALNGTYLTPVDSEGNPGAPIALARPYVINWAATEIELSTPEELAEFAEVANGQNPFFGGDKHSFEGQTIKLANDIDLGDYWWYYDVKNEGEFAVEVDRRIVDFKGTLDGQNFSIKNMKYYDHNGADDYASGYVSMGMFRTLYGNVLNLTIDTVGGHWNENRTALDPVIAEGSRVAFFPLAYKTRGSLISNVHSKNVNVKIDNANYTYEQDALTSANGLVGVVTWDGSVNNYGREGSQYSRFENCSVTNFKVEMTGNCGYAGGGFAYKASEMSEFENCTVDGATVTIGKLVDNYGGFIGEIGLASVVTDCSVTDFHLTAAQNNRAVAGFMGDTVGGTGWGDSVHINGCTVSNSSIEIETVNAPIGGFVGDLIGGRSAIFGDAKANTVASDVTLTATKSGAGDGIGIPCVGGFLGGLFGRDDLTGSSEHQFTNCSAAATINAGDAPAGGFLGAAIKGEKQQMRVSFSNCTSAGSVTTTGVAAAFGGFDAEGMDIGDKANGDKNYDEYDNTCTSTTNVNGQAPANVEPVAIVGGSSSYSRTLSSGYMELTDTTATSTVYTTFQDPAVQTFRLRRAPVAIDKIVEVEFYRKNAAGAYELWRTIEIFKDTAFDGTGYPYATTYADYRLTGGLASVLDEADDLFIKATAIGFIDENGNPFTDSTIVGSDIKLYAEYGYKVTYELEGSIPEEIEVPEGKIYQAGETVALPTFSEIANYEFRGWNVSADFVMPEENVTITGKWVKVAKPEITGKVKFNDILAAGQFTFILVDEEGKTVATTTNDKNGNFKFQPTLDQGNIYCYTVKQVEGNETLGYDLANFEVIIVVDDDGEFAMASGDIIFKNRAPHRAKVTIDGSVTLDGQAADGFEFVLTDRRGNEVATAESEKGKFSFAFSYTGCGKYTYYLSQVAADGVVCDDVVYEIIVTVKSVGSGYKAQVVYMRTIDLAFANTTAN